ncbi:MAG: cytochrome c oxidase cbb3-type subunit 2 [Planctomycetota bacterium]|jgi:cytochrome c oxidase cbb3-type subunit 2
MERFHTFVFVAGFGCFGLSFVLSVVFPWMTLDQKVTNFMDFEQLAEVRTPEFSQLINDFPDAWAEHYPGEEAAGYAEALQLGRDLYVGQSCWHCHSQFIRPVARETERFGTPTVSSDYQNALNLPHLWGTRRVGPDLSREGGLRSNDWHIAHMIEPKIVVPWSIMPSYAFWFEEDGTPNRDGFAMLAYLQWLGTRSEGSRPQ